MQNLRQQTRKRRCLIQGHRNRSNGDVFISDNSNDSMERSVTHHNDKSVNNNYDDLSPEEVADIREFYSDKTGHKKMSLEELIKELHE